jgi:hypothetical protein
LNNLDNSNLFLVSRFFCLTWNEMKRHPFPRCPLHWNSRIIEVSFGGMKHADRPLGTRIVAATEMLAGSQRSARVA